jgi:hypothetical protein
MSSLRVHLFYGSFLETPKDVSVSGEGLPQNWMILLMGEGLHLYRGGDP